MTSSLLADDPDTFAFDHERLSSAEFYSEEDILNVLKRHGFGDDKRFERAIDDGDEHFVTTFVSVARMLSVRVNVPWFFAHLGTSDAAQSLYLEMLRTYTEAELFQHDKNDRWAFLKWRDIDMVTEYYWQMLDGSEQWEALPRAFQHPRFAHFTLAMLRNQPPTPTTLERYIVEWTSIDDGTFGRIFNEPSPACNAFIRVLARTSDMRRRRMTGIALAASDGILATLRAKRTMNSVDQNALVRMPFSAVPHAPDDVLHARLATKSAAAWSHFALSLTGECPTCIARARAAAPRVFTRECDAGRASYEAIVGSRPYPAPLLHALGWSDSLYARPLVERLKRKRGP